MADVLTPQMFGARGDGQHDDAPAFEAAIRAANEGAPGTTPLRGSGKVFVPKPDRFYRLARTVRFAGVEGVVVEGAATGEGRDFIQYDGNGECAFSLVGANHVTLRDLSIRAVNSPQCVVLLGRSDAARSYGRHLFDHVTLYGAVTVAAFCNFASEENAFRNCTFLVEAGPARSAVLMGQTPPPGVRFEGIQDGTCLCNWFEHCRIMAPPTTPDAAAVLVRVRGGVGDLVFRDSFVGVGHGPAFDFECTREAPIPFGFVMKHIRVETLPGGTTTAGVRFRNAGARESILDGVTIEGMNFGVLGPGAKTIEGGDGVTFRGARFVQNYAVEPRAGHAASSIHRGVGIVVEEPWAAGRFEVREPSPMGPTHLSPRSTAMRMEVTVPPWDAYAVNGGTSHRDVEVAAARVGDAVTVTPRDVIAAPEVVYHARVIAEGVVRVVMTNHGARPHNRPDRLGIEVTPWDAGAA